MFLASSGSLHEPIEGTREFRKRKCPQRLETKAALLPPLCMNFSITTILLWVKKELLRSRNFVVLEFWRSEGKDIDTSTVDWVSR